MLPTDLLCFIETSISKHVNVPVKVINVKKLHGGSVNFSYQLNTSQGSFFIKINKREHFPLMFEKEIDGLNQISPFFPVPKVFCKGEFSEYSFLLLEFIETETANKNHWETFGEKLAKMHQNSSKLFGYKEDNYNGSLLQVNSKTNLWSDFFVQNRLMIQCKMARDKQLIDNNFVTQFEKLYPKISNLFPKEKPSLLHGDLWSGNYIISHSSTPFLIDPAVYYGHREVDIAMTLLFGGFNKQLYESYEAYYPLERGWQQRVDIANIYPLMVHVNLFGASYAQRVKSVIKHLV